MSKRSCQDRQTFYIFSTSKPINTLPMRSILFFLFLASGTLSACTCAFVSDFCTYSSGYFVDSDSAAVIRHVKLLEFRTPELGANLYDFVVIEHLFGGAVADTVTLWGQDGGNCNGPIRQLTVGDEYILLHSTTQGIFSYYEHTLENFENPYPIYDFQGCGPAALNVTDDLISGPIAPGINAFTVEELKAEIADCVTGKLVSTINGELPAVSFRAWPNPTAGALNVSFAQSVTADRLDIIDMTGRIVSTTDGLAAQEIRSIEVNAQDLPSGVYVVRVLLINGRVGSKRIVVR